MVEPCELSAVEARRLIGRKRLSPIELLESCIARIEMVNGSVNAMVATCYDRARDEARAAADAVVRGDPLGPLHGLPLGVKDLIDTEGLRTTYGSPLYADNVPDADENLVVALRRAGAIIVGKTNTPEFGAGANTTNPVYGATGNPFDPKRICGGSSGGSAVALATDMTPIHLEDIGPHYAETLRRWRQGFDEHREEVRSLGFSDRFLRMWEFYFCYCEAAFATNYVADYQLVLERPGGR